MVRVLGSLGLFGLTLLYFSDSLTGGHLLVERDLTTFFYPFRFIGVEIARQGHFPFWNPYLKCGVPLFATIQPGVLYPLNLPYLFLPLDLCFNWTVIFHFFLAALFTYALVRELGASAQGAFAAGAAFLCSGYLISVHNVLNTLVSVSWYPAVILCGCKLARSGRKRWAVAGGVSLCCMLLGGGMEIVLFALASLLILCVYPEVLPLKAEEAKPKLRRRLWLLGLTVLTFLGLSLVQLLPFLELYRLSDRYAGMALKEATRWSLAPRDLIYFLLPDLYGPRTTPERYWNLQNYLKSIYMGPVVLVLAGVFFIKKGSKGLPLLAALTLTLALALGGFTPIYSFFYRHLPFFASLRYPVKFLFITIFFLYVVSGLGFDFMVQRFTEKRPPPLLYQWLLVTAVVILAGVLSVTHFYPVQTMSLALSWWEGLLDPAFLPTALHNLNRMLVIVILTLIVIFFGLRHRPAHLGGPLLLILLILDLFLGNRGFAIRLDAAKFHAATEVIRTLNADPDLFRFHTVSLAEVSEGVRVSDYEGFHRLRKEHLEYDLMMEHHLFDIDGYNVPLQPRYEKFMYLIRGKPLAPVRNLLDMLNVKYVLTDAPVELPDFVWIRNGVGPSKLYENRNCLPRAYLVSNFQVLQSDEDFARALSDPNFDPRRQVFLEKVPESYQALKKEPALRTLKPAVRVISYVANRFVLEATAPEAALLFMSEAYYPGWQSYVDGKQVEILRANYTFRAVPLGPGTHRVEMVCRPLSFRLGLALSLLTIFLLVTGWVISTRRQVLCRRGTRE